MGPSGAEIEAILGSKALNLGAVNDSKDVPRAKWGCFSAPEGHILDWDSYNEPNSLSV